MKPIAIIPARGGSKRLPRKNILSFLGKPLISHVIDMAWRSGLFSKIIVSTEDDEIARVAAEYGAEIIIRPEELAQDTSTVVEVCIHALKSLSAEGIRSRDICCIYATAALLNVEDLRGSYAELSGSEVYDSVMGVAEYDLSPFQALHQSDGRWTLRWPEFKAVQSQNYPQVYCSCGALYWIRTEVFLSEHSFYTPNLGVYVIPRSRLCDINTPEDFYIAEQRAILNNTNLQ